MTPVHYILNETGAPIIGESFEEWIEWNRTHIRETRIAQTQFASCTGSTIF